MWRPNRSKCTLLMEKIGYSKPPCVVQYEMEGL